MTPARSPYLTAPEAALYLRMENADGTPNMNAFYVARHRHRIRARRRGWKLLFKVEDLEAFLEHEGKELEAFKRRSTLRMVHGQKVSRGR